MFFIYLAFTFTQQDFLSYFRGTTKAIFQAQQLISGLVAKKKSETKLSSHQATSSLKSPQKQQEQIKRTTQTLVAAPVPARPAWVVPLSFLVRANQKVHKNI